MKITGGTLKGRPVAVPARPGLRPTSARVREAVFHRLAPVLPQARVLDAFGGSGILAFEAWSRGATDVVCVERDRVAARAVQATASKLGAEIDVRNRDVRRAPPGPYDLILADPPYTDAPTLWLRTLRDRLAPDGLLVFEHRAGTFPTGRLEGLRVTWQRRYGDSEVTILEPLSA